MLPEKRKPKRKKRKIGKKSIYKYKFYKICYDANFVEQMFALSRLVSLYFFTVPLIDNQTRKSWPSFNNSEVNHDPPQPTTK